MIKNIFFRIARFQTRKTLPKINSFFYKKMFNLSYRFFLVLKPSQIWVIILALLNKMNLKSLISIPSMLILFNSIFNNSGGVLLKDKSLYTLLEGQKLTDEENDLESFFWSVIILALIKRFLNKFFKILWLPFKLAMYYYILKLLGFDLTFIFKHLNNLTLGVTEWFYDKIIDFIDKFKNDKIP